MSGDGRRRSEWNRILLEDILSELYVRFVLHLKQECGTKAYDRYLSYWPVETPAEKWNLLLKSIYRRLMTEEVLYTDTGGGKWVTPASAVLLTETSQNIDRKRLREVLQRCGVNVVVVPPAVFDLLSSLEWEGPSPNTTTPSFVREYLRSCGHIPHRCSKEDTLFLLSFVLSDLTESMYGELTGVPLLPLASGAFAPFIHHKPHSELDEEGVDLENVELEIVEEKKETDGKHRESGTDEAGKEAPPPFVLSSPDELNLLPTLHDRLIAVETLPHDVKRHFRNAFFQAQTGIYSMTPSYFSLLLYSCLPPSWKGATRVRLPHYRSTVADASGGAGHQLRLTIVYLKELWTYISQCDDLSLFSEYPLLLCRGDTLCRLSQDSHLLSPYISTSMADAADFFQSLGVNFVDRRVIWSHPSKFTLIRKSENPIDVLMTVHRILHADDTVLSSLRSHASSNFSSASSTPSAPSSYASIAGSGSRAASSLHGDRSLSFRTYVVSQLSRLTSMKVPQGVLSVLQTLPVFECYPDRTWQETAVNVQDDDVIKDKDQYESAPRSPFVSLSERKLYVAPADLDHRLLGSSFIRAGSPGERDLLRFAGVEERSGASIYLEDVFPYLSHMDDELRDSTMLTVLQQLPHLYREDPSMMQTLKELSFVPVIELSEDGREERQLYPPHLLYDPRVTELLRLLDQRRFFPAPSFRSATAIESLVGLGLRKQLDWSGIVHSAESVVMLTRDNSEKALALSESLILYLNTYARQLFEGETEETLQPFLEKLSALEWVPVQTRAPLEHQPWREVEGMPLKRLADVRPEKDAWLCSASLFILKGSVFPQNLIHSFGWDKDLPPTIVARQLSSLSEIDISLLSFEEVRKLRQVFLRLYSLLNKCDWEAENISQILPNHRRCLLMEQRVVAPLCVAYSPQLRMPPYLYKVPRELLEFESFLRNVGVQSSFDIRSLARVTGRMHEDFVGEDGRSVAVDETNLGYVATIAKTICVGLDERRKKKRGRDARIRMEANSHVDEEKGKVDPNRPAPANSSSSGSASVPIDIEEEEKEETIFLQQLELKLPDTKGILRPVNSLLYDDAEWLSGIQNRDTMHFIHPSIPTEVAARLGAGSLRSALLMNNTVTEEVRCPFHTDLRIAMNDLKHVSPEDSCQFLLDVVEVADLLGSKVFEVYLDETTYPSESLFMPHLAALQGPALCIYFDQTLLPDELTQLQDIVSMYGRVNVRDSYTHFGQGLASCYAISDALCVMSGGSLTYFDPCRMFFADLEQQPSKDQKGRRQSLNGGKSGFGKVFKFVGSDTNLTEKFPDQFSPFEGLPFGFSKTAPLQGTIVRLPLRVTSSPLAAAPFPLDAARDVLLSFRSVYRECMLFARSLVAVKAWGSSRQLRKRYGHFKTSTTITSSPPSSSSPSSSPAGHNERERSVANEESAKVKKEEVDDEDDEEKKHSEATSGDMYQFQDNGIEPRRPEKATCVFMVNLVTTGSTLTKRRHVHHTSDWKNRSFFGALFSSGVEKQTTVLTLSSQDNLEDSIFRDEWAVTSCLGHNTATDLALEQIKTAKKGIKKVGSPGNYHPNALPMAEVAAHISRNSLLPPPTEGRVFVHCPLPGEFGRISGVPVHINVYGLLCRSTIEKASSTPPRSLFFDKGMFGMTPYPPFEEENSASGDNVDEEEEEKKDGGKKMNKKEFIDDDDPDTKPPVRSTKQVVSPDPMKVAVAQQEKDMYEFQEVDETEEEREKRLKREEKERMIKKKKEEAARPKQPLSEIHRYNLSLVQECAMDAYISLLSYLSTSFDHKPQVMPGSMIDIYELWPCGDRMLTHWRDLFLNRFYEFAVTFPLFLTTKNKFEREYSATFRHSEMNDTVARFVSRSETLSRVPSFIAKDMSRHAPKKVSVHYYNPKKLRTALHKTAVVNVLTQLHRYDATGDLLINLLQFACLDLKENGTYHHLQNLRLLPRLDGTIGVWGKDKLTVFSEEHFNLLPSGRVFLHNRLLEELPHLVESADARKRFFVDFSPELLAENISQIFDRKVSSTDYVYWRWTEEDEKLFPSEQTRPGRGTMEREREGEDEEKRMLVGGEWSYEMGSEEEKKREEIPLERRGGSSSSLYASPSSPSLTPPKGIDHVNGEGLPSVRWLLRFWKYMGNHLEDLHLFNNFAFIPLRSVHANNKGQPQFDCELGRVSHWKYCARLNERNESLLSALSQIRYPVVDLRFMNTIERSVLLDEVYSRSLPRIVLHGVHARDLYARVSFQMLYNDGARVLCDFFAKGFSAGIFSDSDRVLLRRTPIFESLDISEYVCDEEREKENTSAYNAHFYKLDDPSRCFILAIGFSLPRAFAEFISNEDILLKYKHADFYRFVGVSQLDEADVYQKYIQRGYEVLFDEDRYRMMETLQQRWRKIKNDRLKEVVAEIPFVAASYGSDHEMTEETEREEERVRGGYEREERKESMLLVAHCANQLYDPHNVMFQRLFHDEMRFPSTQFRSGAWIPFLKELGLRSSLKDADTFLDCATQVAKYSRGPLPLAIGSIAKHLVEYLWRHFTDLSTPPFWKSLAQIPFIPLFDPDTKVFRLFRYSEAAVYDDRHLVWTVMPTLPPWAVPPQMFFSKLHVTSPPKYNDVLRHLLNITSVPMDKWSQFTQVKVETDQHVFSARERERGRKRERKEDSDSEDDEDVFDSSSESDGAGGETSVLHSLDTPLIGKPIDVFQSLFRYLDELWEKLPEREHNRLSSMAIVPVGNRYVKPYRLYFQLSENLSPFMFQVPRAFGNMESFLCKLGTKEEPTLEDYLKFLHELKEECGDECLNVNELAAVIHVVDLISNEVKNNRSVRSAIKKMKLLVPNEETRLIPSLQCVYNDSPLISSRIDHSKVTFASPQMPFSLCDRVGIRRLSSVLSERMILSPQDNLPLADIHIQYEIDRMNQLLCSSEFVSGLLRIYEDHIGRKQDYTMARRIPNRSSLEKLLAKITVKATSSIRTRVLYNPNRSGSRTADVVQLQDVTVDGQESTAYFISETEGNNYQVLLSSSYASTIRPALTTTSALCKLLLKTIRIKHGETEIAPLDVENRSLIEAMLEQQHPRGTYFGFLSVPYKLYIYIYMSLCVPLYFLLTLSPSPPLFPLSSLPSLPRTTDIPRMLDQLEVYRLNHISLRRGVPGEPLSSNDLDLLELRPLRAFLKHEVVAVRVEDPSDKEPSLLTTSSPSPSPASTSTSASSQYKYAKIVADSEGAVEGEIRWVSVHLNLFDTADLPATDIFSFRTSVAHGERDQEPQVGRSSSSFLPPSVSSTRTQQAPLLPYPSHDRGEADTFMDEPFLPSFEEDMDAFEEKKEDPSKLPGSNVLQAEREERERLMFLEAAQALLEKAQLPLSLEAKDLMEANRSLRHKTERLTQEAQLAKDELRVVSERLERLQSAHICSICQDNEVDKVLVRCGHRVCHSCEERLRATRKCPFCREHYTAVIPYFKPE